MPVGLKLKTAISIMKAAGLSDTEILRVMEEQEKAELAEKREQYQRRAETMRARRAALKGKT